MALERSSSDATAGALVALILAFGGISGAQFNPVVTAALALRGLLPAREVAPHVAAQLADFDVSEGVTAGLAPTPAGPGVAVRVRL